MTDLTTQFNGKGIHYTKHMCAIEARNAETFEGFTRHTDYHWSTSLNGKRLDFWPSKNKWRWNEKTYNALHSGYSVLQFIKAQDNAT